MTAQVVKAPNPATGQFAAKAAGVKPVVPRAPGRPSVSRTEIRLFAYEKWIAAGQPPGDGVQFWLEAEQQLMNGK